MASAVVSSVTNKLGGLLIQEVLVLYSVRDDVRWIQKELRMMQCFLKDADSRQNEEERLKEWVAEIIQVSYDAEDVIDTFIYSQNALRRRRGFAEWVRRCVCIVGELVSELITQYMVSKKIEKIKKRIRDIKERRETYGIRDINEERHEASSSRQSLEKVRRFSAQLLEEPEVVGQQEEINALKMQLINREQRRCVISIYGMGGLGKTTLARKVYENVKHKFACHAFVCMSQQYEMKDVLIRVIARVMGNSREEMEKFPEDVLGTMLRDHLKGKRYLVVFDDIWSKEAWNMLGFVLPNGKDKSRVMLTTRIKDVAVHPDPSSPPHQMRLLNDNEGWELFMKKVFPGEKPSAACPSELKEIGRKIFKKCGGLPLAILVIGGLLATKDKAFHAWDIVLKCVPRHLTESSEQCMKILALSYWDLPYYLKPCFLYLGLFPEDYEIGSGRLIRLWIAEGFVEQRDGELMEDVAEDYLEQLVGRSMIQVVARKSNGLVQKCRLHDLFRDLCISEASQINFFTIYKDNGASSSSTSVRRLAFHGNVDGYEPSKSSTKSLRSILYFPNSEVPLSKLLNTKPKLVRVSKTNFVDFSSEVTLYEEIGVFAHLRYLEIKYIGSSRIWRPRRLVPLPPSVGDLSNLQTLRVKGAGAILPSAIFNLKQLRHLHALFCDIDGHPRLENLRNLCTLKFTAGSWMEDGLDKLTNLRELKICGGDFKSYQNKAVSDIEKLHNLQSLTLEHWHSNSSPTFMPFTRHLHLSELHLCGRRGKLSELPPNLAKLTLTCTDLQEDVISTLEKLSYLKILEFHLESYISEKMSCSSGGFPRLEVLTLSELNEIQELIVEEGAMPVIKSVVLDDLPNLSKTTLPSRVCDLVKRIR